MEARRVGRRRLERRLVVMRIAENPWSEARISGTGSRVMIWSLWCRCIARSPGPFRSLGGRVADQSGLPDPSMSILTPRSCGEGRSGLCSLVDLPVSNLKRMFHQNCSLKTIKSFSYQHKVAKKNPLKQDQRFYAGVDRAEYPTVVVQTGHLECIP